MFYAYVGKYWDKLVEVTSIFKIRIFKSTNYMS